MLKSVALHNELTALEREAAQLSFYETRAGDRPAQNRETAQIYSLASILRAEPGQTERMVSARLAETFGPAYQRGELRGYWVPMTALARDLAVTATGQGAELVQTSVARNLIEVLRPRCAVLRTGATMLEGLRSNLTIARQATTVAPTWADENELVADGTNDFTFDMAGTLRPFRAVTSIVYSNQLLRQRSVNIEAVVLRDMADAIAVAVDQAVINGGAAASNQPTRLFTKPVE